MLEESIRKWNPWWAELKELDNLTGEKRSIIQNINQLDAEAEMER